VKSNSFDYAAPAIQSDQIIQLEQAISEDTGYTYMIGDRGVGKTFNLLTACKLNKSVNLDRHYIYIDLRFISTIRVRFNI
jgi:type II secretory pathway predicted ATPase ExeA